MTESFVREYPGSDQSGLLLMGNSGVGKSHLAIAALSELVGKAIVAISVNMGLS